MGERPKVVVDVQFQGRETEYGIVQEQFEFELVGSRIHVRPCASDHPQGAVYSDHPRKRPASPRNEPCQISRVNPKRSQEELPRFAKSKSTSPSPSRRNVKQKVIRYRDQSTSPCVLRKKPYEDSDERFSSSERRTPWCVFNHDDSNSSFSSYPAVRTQPRKSRKETSMWNISQKESDNNSIETSASLGDIRCGSLRYCVQQENDGNYSFTARRTKNNDRTKQERRNLAVQAGYDEDLRFKRLKQFSGRRNKNDMIQRNKLMIRDTTEPKYNRYNSEFNDEELRNERRQYRKSEEKKCLFSCHPCCSNEIPPVVYQEFEMFNSSETIRREIVEDNERDEEEDLKKTEGNKKMYKDKRKPPKKESQISNEPEEYEEGLEDEELKHEVQKPKKNKQGNKQKSKNDKTSKILIKEEKVDEDIDEDRKKDVPLKKVNLHPKNEVSPESAGKKEGKHEERENRTQSKTRLSPDRPKKKVEIEEERESRTDSYNRLSPESAKKKFEIKEEGEKYLRMTRNCCRKASLKKQGYFDEQNN